MSGAHSKGPLRRVGSGSRNDLVVSFSIISINFFFWLLKRLEQQLPNSREDPVREGPVCWA